MGLTGCDSSLTGTGHRSGQAVLIFAEVFKLKYNKDRFLFDPNVCKHKLTLKAVVSQELVRLCVGLLLLGK